MKHRKMKKLLTALLAVSLLLPALPGMGIKVHAAEPGITQFATKEELASSFDLTEDGTVGILRFGAGIPWFIAGLDTANDSLVLLSIHKFANEINNGGDKYSEGEIANDILPGYLSDTRYFSITEQSYMVDTTVSTLEYDQSDEDPPRTKTGKLYLPDAKEGRRGSGSSTICVGTNSDISVALSQLGNGFTYDPFWLRSSHLNVKDIMLVGQRQHVVFYVEKGTMACAVVPAFNLNLSSVLFASAAPAATAEGALTPEDAMTLRYDAELTLGTAAINPAQTSVGVSGAPEGTYLVVQNDSGAWAKAVRGDASVSANQVTIDGGALASFEDCKVWLETTDITERITKASMAVQEYETTIINPSGSHITRSTAAGNGAETQIVAPGTAITDVVYTADSGYYFPENYSVAAVSGITVTRDNGNQITVSGTPAADAEITLAAATEQTYTITTDPAALNYGTVNRDEKGSYTQPEAQTVTVRNTGNSAVTLTKPTSTGYAIGELSKGTLLAGETATFTVQPKGDLSAGTYSETLKVTTDKNTTAEVAVNFTVKAKSEDAPKITKGAESKWTKGSKEGLSFTSNAEFDKFKKVMIDGEDIDASHYTVKSGSTIVTLKAEYLETLKAGKHTISIVSENGTADASFTIEGKADKPASDKQVPSEKGKSGKTPQTGDNSHLFLWLILLALCGGTITVIGIRRKRI